MLGNAAKKKNIMNKKRIKEKAAVSQAISKEEKEEGRDSRVKNKSNIDKMQAVSEFWV